MHASAPVAQSIERDIEMLRSSLLKLFGKESHSLDIPERVPSRAPERVPSRAPERIFRKGITLRYGRIFVYLLDFLPADLPYNIDKPTNTKDWKIVPATFFLENLGWCASFINGTLIIDVRSLFNIDYVLRDDRALNLLAFLFTISGILESNDEEKVAAVKIFRYAVERGNPCAKLNLGRCLALGVGVNDDQKQAANLYWQITEEADRRYGRIADWASVPFCGVYASAQYHYGRCLLCGTGVPKDVKEAVKYFKLSAENGNPLGQCNYGRCLDEGIGLAENKQEAVKYYRLSADQGLAIAQYNYGICLEDGIGIKRNLAEAAKYYRLSADQGYAGGQCNYGICLVNGIGIKMNKTDAVKYFKLSADQGHAQAQYNYGVCLEHGFGIETNQGEAAKYYRLSADQGDADARLRLAGLKRGTGSQ
jgi:TPR repeat protein